MPVRSSSRDALLVLDKLVLFVLEEVSGTLLDWELLSSVNCIKCGKITKNSKGQSIIWRTQGWIAPFCKNCAKRQMVEYGYNKAKIRAKLKKIREVNPLFIVKSESSSTFTEKQYVLSNNKLKQDIKCNFFSFILLHSSIYHYLRHIHQFDNQDI